MLHEAAGTDNIHTRPGAYLKSLPWKVSKGQRFNLKGPVSIPSAPEITPQTFPETEGIVSGDGETEGEMDTQTEGGRDRQLYCSQSNTTLNANLV